MNKLLALLALPVLFFSCKSNTPLINNESGGKQLSALLAMYWEERQQLFPADATANGDNRYNDRLTIPLA